MSVTERIPTAIEVAELERYMIRAHEKRERTREIYVIAHERFVLAENRYQKVWDERQRGLIQRTTTT